MAAYVNPEFEQIRAQAVLRSFTDQNEAAKLFGPSNPNRNSGGAIMRVFNAIKLNRRPTADAAAQSAYAPRQVTESGC